ncbi:MAG: glycerol-3-phosphate 1-O-acyltransferase PlsY [Cytophagales bacterium]|jgi:glycerol-3-phosphate acyltransferase PlsY|nr:glycerol-3-phosphate 1-O-acyltransferase PlsY [Cytophagales bacterium]
MDVLLIIAGFVMAYLLGSLPTSVWLGQAYFGIDVRDFGSGNAGATNTFRVLGRKAGIIVMLVDILKGWTATSLALLLYLMNVIPFDDLLMYKLLFGILSVIGHIFPVYVGFKGGKGVATLLGMVLAIHTEAALLCIVIFFVVLLTSKYVSLGSMIAALAFPILLLLPRFSPDDPMMIVFGFVMFAIVVITHQKNIVRLLNGEESRTNIRLRKK